MSRFARLLAPDSPQILARLFLTWTFVRAVLHNGWWVVTSLFMVVDAGLSPAQLVLIAAAQAAASMVFEIPAGVLGDTLGRKPSIVVSHLLMAMAMVLTGWFPTFGALLAAQVVWGIAWTFSSGSDVAWITDELRQPERIHLVLISQARAQLLGAGVGIIAFGALAAAVGRQEAIVTAGVLMFVLGVGFALTFPERHFVKVERNHVQAALDIARRGARLAVTDRVIFNLVIVTVLVNGAADSFGRIYPVQLTDVGLPDTTEGTVWFAAINLVALITAALLLSAVQHTLDSDRGARLLLICACLAGSLGFTLLGTAPSLGWAVAAVVVTNGAAMPLIRTVTTIWVNRRTTSDIRATTHSFLAQAEYLGEILCALALVAVLEVTSTAKAIIWASATLLISAFVIARLARPKADPGG